MQITFDIDPDDIMQLALNLSACMFPELIGAIDPAVVKAQKQLIYSLLDQMSESDRAHYWRLVKKMLEAMHGSDMTLLQIALDTLKQNFFDRL